MRKTASRKPYGKVYPDDADHPQFRLRSDGNDSKQVEISETPLPMNKPTQEIAPGSEVTLHLSLSTTSGLEALSTFGQEPETFVMGDGTLAEGLELALYGLKPGDTQTLTLTADQAFGQWDKSRIQQLPHSNFPPTQELEPGLVMGFSLPDGGELAGTILKVDENEVTVDFNHPLAGREVVFRVEILEVKGQREIHFEEQ